MKLNEAFARRVKELLKAKKMTQHKLAQETGLYYSTNLVHINKTTFSCGIVIKRW